LIFSSMKAEAEADAEAGSTKVFFIRNSISRTYFIRAQPNLTGGPFKPAFGLRRMPRSSQPCHPTRSGTSSSPPTRRILPLHYFQFQSTGYFQIDRPANAEHNLRTLGQFRISAFNLTSLPAF
jgi:hypothetical protein